MGMLPRPASGVRPAGGLKLAMPQNVAGTCMLPPRSVPSPSDDPPAAMIAASPPLLTPGERPRSQGLFVRP